MASIVINNFGGIMPAVEPRALPPDGAREAVSLNMRHGDFRPSLAPGAPAATVVANARSVFRTPSGEWLSSATDTDYVLGQLQGDVAERVYLVGRSAFAESYQGGQYRRLGVPAPTAAPTVTVVTADEFTVEEASAGKAAAVTAYEAAINSALTASYAGYENVVLALPRGAFWLPHGTVVGMPTNSAQMGCYCVPLVVNGTGYAPVDPADAFLLRPVYGGTQIVYLGTTYWAAPFYARANTLTFDKAVFKTAVKLIKRPDNPAEQLIADPTIDDIALRYEKLFIASEEPQKAMIALVNQHVAEIGRVFLANSQESLAAATRAFYAKSEIAAYIAQRIARAAEGIHRAAEIAWNAPATMADTYIPPAEVSTGGL